MRQVTQRLRDGRIDVVDIERPSLAASEVLVAVHASLLSAGTERTKVRTAQQGLVGKARSRPDQVRQVIDKARREGVGETVHAVRTRLESPSPLGYSAAGVVVEAGPQVRDLVPGDRVACGGASAAHAELDSVPSNLCVRLPEGVDFEEGAFATLGSIALHGARQADVRLGERVAVVGLGLVGQLVGQLLRASGCSVVGIDLTRPLVDHALEHGAADVAYVRSELDDQRLPVASEDCDAVVITAATGSSDPVELAARLARDRGRVVIVGDVGLELPRAAYYDKELELRLSRSYGPGRYDVEYEQKGLDYPIGYVRWTERRNMAAFVALVGAGRVDVRSLVTARVPLEEAPDAYERLVGEERSPLAMILKYSVGSTASKPRPISAAPMAAPAGWRRTGVIGAGSFAQRVLIPSLAGSGFELAAVASASGLSARGAAERFNFGATATAEELIADPQIGTLAIATRHSSHARYAVAGLTAGKAVFVEKPPCLNLAELEVLSRAEKESGSVLGVGFNRRHAPGAQALRSHVAGRGAPIELLYRVNSGALAADHWLNDLTEGGGRLVGEGCHFVDFACWVTGQLPERISCLMRPEPGAPLAAAQSFTVSMEFADGSLASVLYTSGGAGRLAKEQVEAHAGGRSAILRDFRSLELFEHERRGRRRRLSGSKGHGEQFEHLAQLLAGEVRPINPPPLETMRATLAALLAAGSGVAESLSEVRGSH